ncbi:MAG: Aminomethyltransferase [Hyphomicrobiaceae bacterium hypho_1]
MVMATKVSLKRTPLYHAHVSSGAKIMPFAGYEMPLHYHGGIIEEHNWTRKNAGLFDVGHMGVARILDKSGSHDRAAQAIEKLVPADIQELPPGFQRYTQLTNTDGGILDDLIISRSPDRKHEGMLTLVLNAARKNLDYAHIDSYLPTGVKLQPLSDFMLLALQGPAASDVIKSYDIRADSMRFMSVATITIAGTQIQLSRSGYTGEDGFELLVPTEKAIEIWESISSDPRVKPIGLGARNCLRLEAGLCLYGHDLDETTSPVEACLTWSIQKTRRQKGGFLGERRILDEIRVGPQRKRVGLMSSHQALAREGTPIHDVSGKLRGSVTSGSYGPTVAGPVAMGYIQACNSEVGTDVFLMIRGKACAAKVVALPFVHHHYKR